MRGRMAHLTRTLENDAAYQRSAGVFPLINVTEDADNFWVRAELPGVRADELDLSLTANHLTLSGERKIATPDASVKWHRREREAGKFSRVIKIPDRVDGDKIQAKMSDGILSIALPKSASAKPRQIEIG
jgi:HSP20 family protein